MAPVYQSSATGRTMSDSPTCKTDFNSYNWVTLTSSMDTDLCDGKGNPMMSCYRCVKQTSRGQDRKYTKERTQILTVVKEEEVRHHNTWCSMNEERYNDTRRWRWYEAVLLMKKIEIRKDRKHPLTTLEYVSVRQNTMSEISKEVENNTMARVNV
jgi:hypothetical protein